ncbi:MAG: hypothetical protein ACTTJH_08390 [Bacteroidales bacterium]
MDFDIIFTKCTGNNISLDWFIFGDDETKSFRKNEEKAWEEEKKFYQNIIAQQQETINNFLKNMYLNNPIMEYSNNMWGKILHTIQTF